MPLNLRASKKLDNFNLSVSYRIFERGNKFIEARNVFSTQNRLETRFGYSRYMATQLSGPVLSLSYFSKSDGNQYTLAKVGTELIKVNTTGSHTVVKSGLTSTTKHRAVTDNNRHIIAIESDGLFSYDGTTFTQLGQAAPSTLTATIAAGGALTSGDNYQAAITYYASSIGFESNYISSGIVTASGANLRVALTAIPATADNAFVDKVRVYLKNVSDNGTFRFIAEINLGTTSYNIDNESTSAVEAPENNGAPLSGGGKYLATFNTKTVYAGNSSFPNDVFFSEEYLPDAYNPNDDQIVLTIQGKGGITGLGVGLFNDSAIDPFLCIFKRKSIHIYSEIGDLPKLVTISNEIGCVSHDTIQVKNGVVYFLSEEGWRAIVNGKLITNEQGEAITLANGDVDDIFKSSGYVYEINKSKLTETFSVYYPTLDQYMTWVAEGSNNAFSKTYVYEMDIGGFKPWEFSIAATCACLAEDATFKDIVLFADSNGWIYKHSNNESRSDVDVNNTEIAYQAYAVLPWYPLDGDFDATYNFRELILRGIVSANGLTVKTFINFNFFDTDQAVYQFTDPNSGFILDESMLDVGVFGDERSIVTARADINRVGECIAIGFYQEAIDANIGLIAIQMDASKNGNRNLN